MKILKTNSLTESQKERIVELWNTEYPAQLQHSGTKSFDEYLSRLGNPEHYLLTDESGNIKGWLACFVRNGAKWFAMIVDSFEQKKGYGAMLMSKVKEFETEINGWAIDQNKDVKADGKPYLSPVGFYLKNGFEILNDVRFETETMSAVKIRWTNELYNQKSNS